jgi:dTDP-4-dehydrorhamnose 3,5-epimerase
MTTAIKAVQTVTADGRSVKPAIAGVAVRAAVTQQDERGTLCEIYSPAWGLDDLPLVYAYLVTVRPGRVKGWAVHERHVDRYFFAGGSLKLVLYDGRAESPTHGLVSELYFSDFNRSLVSVPPGVYHAVENVGSTEAMLFNLPSEPYDHAQPDKFILPLDNDLIPYSFERLRGY